MFWSNMIVKNIQMMTCDRKMLGKLWCKSGKKIKSGIFFLFNLVLNKRGTHVRCINDHMSVFSSCKLCSFWWGSILKSILYSKYTTSEPSFMPLSTQSSFKGRLYMVSRFLSHLNHPISTQIFSHASQIPTQSVFLDLFGRPREIQYIFNRISLRVFHFTFGRLHFFRTLYSHIDSILISTWCLACCMPVMMMMMELHSGIYFSPCIILAFYLKTMTYQQGRQFSCNSCDFFSPLANLSFTFCVCVNRNWTNIINIQYIHMIELTWDRKRN